MIFPAKKKQVENGPCFSVNTFYWCVENFEYMDFGKVRKYGLQETNNGEGKDFPLKVGTITLEY